MAPTEKSEAHRVPFHFIKSNYYRVIHGDGFWGGATPAGSIFMSVYSERGPIPTKIFMEIGEEGAAIELSSERETRDGPVREVEAGIILDLGTARALRVWLDEKISQVEAMQAGRESE